MTLTRAQIAPDADEMDLLGGEGDLLEVAHLAAMATAAARRIATGSGTVPDEDDKGTFDALASLFDESATAIEFFGPPSSASVPLSGAVAGRVDAALDAVIYEDTLTPDQAKGLAESLRGRVASLRSLAEGEPSESADVVAFLSKLSSRLISESGHVGDSDTRI